MQLHVLVEELDVVPAARHLDLHLLEGAQRAARRLEVAALLDGRDEALRPRLVDAALVARRGDVEPQLDQHLVLGQRCVVVGHLDHRVALLRVGLGHVVERHLERGLGAWEVGAGACRGCEVAGAAGGGKEGGRWREACGRVPLGRGQHLFLHAPR